MPAHRPLFSVRVTPTVTRRSLLAVAVGAATSSCGSEGTSQVRDPELRASPYARGRLRFTLPAGSPRTAGDTDRPGLVRLGVSAEGAPASAWVPRRPASGGFRLVVVLHGAGGEPAGALRLLEGEADQHGLLLVAPKSAAATWDVLSGGYGPDVRHVDRLLERVTHEYPVHACTIAGFSDGASYALSLGLGNGDVFDSVVAFSPGFTAEAEQHGRPRFFVSHGTADRVLPIDRCSRRIVPELERAGYDVTYEEFDGAHQVPVEIRKQAATWLTA